jgi:hypothetical protein
VQDFLPGLVRFLSNGIGSASASDPAEMDAVMQLLCPDVVDKCLEAMNLVERQSTSIKAIVAEQAAYHSVSAI